MKLNLVMTIWGKVRGLMDVGDDMELLSFAAIRYFVSWNLLELEFILGSQKTILQIWPARIIFSASSQS